MTATLPPSWQSLLAEEQSKPYYRQLQEFVAAERSLHQVFPPESEVFAALEHTPYEKVNVLLLGRDPYPGQGQAHGLAFSVRPHVTPLPGSLLNIFKELRDDVGFHIPNNGYLVPWAEQGMLMLNAVLTVRAYQPNSHKGHGWEKFTDSIINAVNDKPDPVVFVLWGNYARKKVKLIDTNRHTIIESAHPSPLSAQSGFSAAGRSPKSTPRCKPRASRRSTGISRMCKVLYPRIRALRA